MKINLITLEDEIRKDLQTIERETSNWINGNAESHNFEYTLEELCSGVENEEIPYMILWYVLKYYKLDEADSAKIITTLNLDADYKDFNVRDSFDITNSEKVFNSESVEGSTEVTLSSYIKYSEHIIASKYVNHSKFVSSSKKVSESFHIFDSTNISFSSYISNSSDVDSSQYIKSSSNISNSRFCIGCKNFEYGLFCVFIKDESNKYYIFNKEVSKEIFDRTQNDLLKTFNKIFPNSYIEKSYIRERDIRAFKDYCKSIIGYDELIFNYLMKEIFFLWKQTLVGGF